jgi:hypothetical protein
MVAPLIAANSFEIDPKELKWREVGWKDLIEEFAPDSIGAELVEMEAT